jgi:acetyl esterase/lipase
LCPQVTFAEQLDDLRDAWAWCLKHLEAIVGKGNIDLGRSVIGGESAGATFATLSGFFLKPRPSVIINFYGPVLLSHPHFHIPTDDWQQVVASLQYSQPRTIEELEAALRDNNPAHAKTRFPWWPDLEVSIEKLQTFFGLPDYIVGEEERLRMDLYKYMTVKRNRFSTVFRRHALSTEEYQEILASFSALELIKAAPDFPPTFFVHGTADNAAPIGPSQAMYDELQKLRVPVGARWVTGADHSFDVFITVRFL